MGGPAQDRVTHHYRAPYHALGEDATAAATRDAFCCTGLEFLELLGRDDGFDLLVSLLMYFPNLLASSAPT